MEFEQVLELVDRVAAAGLSSFVYETADTKIALKGRENGPAALPAGVSAFPQHQEPEAAAAGLGDGSRENALQLSGRIVTSPLVGTFYAAPSEDAAPYVKVGDSVKKGQILAIVEAMKLMNEIESEYDGVVSRILVKDGEPVEYGQPLFCLE